MRKGKRWGAAVAVMAGMVLAGIGVCGCGHSRGSVVDRFELLPAQESLSAISPAAYEPSSGTEIVAGAESALATFITPPSVTRGAGLLVMQAAEMGLEGPFWGSAGGLGFWTGDVADLYDVLFQFEGYAGYEWTVGGKIQTKLRVGGLMGFFYSAGEVPGLGIDLAMTGLYIGPMFSIDTPVNGPIGAHFGLGLPFHLLHEAIGGGGSTNSENGLGWFIEGGVVWNLREGDSNEVTSHISAVLRYTSTGISPAPGAYSSATPAFISLACVLTRRF